MCNCRFKGKWRAPSAERGVFDKHFREKSEEHAPSDRATLRVFCEAQTPTFAFRPGDRFSTHQKSPNDAVVRKGGQFQWLD